MRKMKTMVTMRLALSKPTNSSLRLKSLSSSVEVTVEDITTRGRHDASGLCEDCTLLLASPNMAAVKNREPESQS